MFTRTWNRRKSASPRCSSLLENREVQMKAEYREVISLLRKGYSIRDVAKLSGKGGKYRTTSEAITKSTIIAITLLILRSFQRKGLCNSGLKAKSTTFVRNITTIRLRSQFVILKMNINMTDKIGKKEATFAVPYNGEDNNDYVDGKGFCCNDGSLEAAQTRALARAAKNNFQEGDTYEKMQFYYHPDHLGSSSYITNLDGEVVQHIEYVPFGEVFIEERNNIWNTPYLFNAKEFDEETGLYYYGARYYDPRVSLWISTDPKQESYFAFSSYVYCGNNPLIYIDPNGKEWEDPAQAEKLKAKIDNKITSIQKSILAQKARLESNQAKGKDISKQERKIADFESRISNLNQSKSDIDLLGHDSQKYKQIFCCRTAKLRKNRGFYVPLQLQTNRKNVKFPSDEYRNCRNRLCRTGIRHMLRRDGRKRNLRRH